MEAARLSSGTGKLMRRLTLAGCGRQTPVTSLYLGKREIPAHLPDYDPGRLFPDDCRREAVLSGECRELPKDAV